MKKMKRSDLKTSMSRCSSFQSLALKRLTRVLRSKRAIILLRDLGQAIIFSRKVTGECILLIQIIARLDSLLAQFWSKTILMVNNMIQSQMATVWKRASSALILDPILTNRASCQPLNQTRRNQKNSRERENSSASSAGSIERYVRQGASIKMPTKQQTLQGHFPSLEAATTRTWMEQRATIVIKSLRRMHESASCEEVRKICSPNRSRTAQARAVKSALRATKCD